MSDFGMWIA